MGGERDETIRVLENHFFFWILISVHVLRPPDDYVSSGVDFSNTFIFVSSDIFCANDVDWHWAKEKNVDSKQKTLNSSVMKSLQHQCPPQSSRIVELRMRH